MNIDETVRAMPELAWFKSSYSSEEGGECVEVATGAATVHVRDSKDIRRPTLTVPSAAWTAFICFAIAQAP